MVAINGTLRLVIPGCELQLCDFELSLCVGALEQVVNCISLGCDWGQRAILGGWSIGYPVKLGGAQTEV